MFEKNNDIINTYSGYLCTKERSLPKYHVDHISSTAIPCPRYRVRHTIGVVLLHSLAVRAATSSEPELVLIDSFSTARDVAFSAPGIVAPVDIVFAGTVLLYVSRSSRTMDHSSACIMAPTSGLGPPFPGSAIPGVHHSRGPHSHSRDGSTNHNPKH